MFTKKIRAKRRRRELKLVAKMRRLARFMSCHGNERACVKAHAENVHPGGFGPEHKGDLNVIGVSVQESRWFRFKKWIKLLFK